MSSGANQQNRQRTFHELEHELYLREFEIQLLKETSEAVSSHLHLDQLFQLVVERARDLIQAETVLLPVIDRDCKQYTYAAGCGKNADEIVGESLPLEYGICGWVWRHNRPWWTGILDELEPEERNRWEQEAGTVIMVPLGGKKHFMGGISGINKIGADNFSKRDLDLLTLFASQVSIALEVAMNIEELEAAQKEAEKYQQELQILNKELQITNKELENLALYDHLTRLPNRKLVQDRLLQQVHTARREKLPFSVIMVDLDRFKEVNDTLGHHVGDELLKKVGMRFKHALRHMDTIGRLGGDEFALVLPNTNAEMACLVADKLLKTLDIPFDLESATCSVDASMGIAVFPYHGDDVPSLLRSADVAMYIAKRNREGYFVYDTKKDKHTVHRLNLAADLHQALDKGELQLYYQPKLDLDSKMISGVEALMRWNHTERGFIPPDVFIPTMEQSGMIRRYTIWALDEAYRQRMEWQKAGYALSMSVNLSVYSLRDRQVLEYIQSLQEQWRPPPGALVMEVTESAVMGDLDYVSGILSELSSQGVQFSIDDFGTGYSSLSHLKRLPVNELKIDRSFVMEMDSDADDATIVRSTVDLAHNLGLRVVAEGVETAETLDALKDLGCNQAQGYFIARPSPPDELITSLESNGWTLCRTDDEAETVGCTRAAPGH